MKKQVPLYCLFQKVGGVWIRVLGKALPYKEACLYYRIWLMHDAIYGDPPMRLFTVKRRSHRKKRRV